MSCGKTIGHGETCQPNYLCGTCVRIAELESENEELMAENVSVAERNLEVTAENQRLREAALKVLQPDGTENGAEWCSIWGEDLDALQAALEGKE